MPLSDATKAAKYAYQKEWRQRNAEALRAKGREKYQRHRVRERAAQRAYYLENADRLRERARANKAAKPIEEVRAYSREWVAKDRQRNRARYLLKSCRLRAARKGIEFSLTEADIQIPDACPVLGIPLDVSPGRPVPPGAPSVDRIDNGRGYTPDNVRVISYRANTLKGMMTLAEAEAIVANWNAR